MYFGFLVCPSANMEGRVYSAASQQGAIQMFYIITYSQWCKLVGSEQGFSEPGLAKDHRVRSGSETVPVDPVESMFFWKPDQTLECYLRYNCDVTS